MGVIVNAINIDFINSIGNGLLQQGIGSIEEVGNGNKVAPVWNLDAGAKERIILSEIRNIREGIA